MIEYHYIEDIQFFSIPVLYFSFFPLYEKSIDPFYRWCSDDVISRPSNLRYGYFFSDDDEQAYYDVS